MSAPSLDLEPSALSPTLPMTSESAFPLEIYEHILDFVTEDIDCGVWKRVLAKTSLVCNGWHPRSRALLFRVLRFGAADEETLRRLRDHLLVAPHLAAYIEEVRLIHRPEDSRLLESFPRWLAVYLPRLRAVFVLVESTLPLNMHHFFCLPGARAQSVTTLEYDHIGLRNTAELEGLLFPYPNARVLTLHLVWWVDLTEKLQGKGLPKPLKVPLSLTELRLMLDGSGWVHIVNRLGFEYILQACKKTLSNLLLNILPIRVLVLPFQEEYPLDIIDFPCLEVLHLEIFSTPEAATGFSDDGDGPDVPYAELISLIPRLLRRLHAVRLSSLTLRFSASDVNQAPDAFLEHLKAIHEPMEELILSSCFPNLKAITFDLGYQIRDVPSWQSRIVKYFPKLGNIVSVQVQPYDNMSENIRSDRLLEFYY